MRASLLLSRGLVLAASIGLAACAGTSRPAAVELPREATARDDGASAAPADPGLLELPPSGVPAAPWLAPPEEAAVDPFENLKTAFVGMKAALATMRAGTFAFHDDLGVVGPLRPPGDTTWIGLDGLDRVLAATSDGTLHRADDVIAARAGRFDRVGAVPGARAWDAGTTWVAAATPSRVLLSADGGRSFRDLGPGGGGAIDRVLVRSDGAVVAQERASEDDARVTWVAAPGKRLQRSPIPFGDLGRRGAWIGGLSPCSAALSTDGERWAPIGLWPRDDDRDRWLRVFIPSRMRAAYARELVESLVAPAPPPPPAPGDELRPGMRCGRRVRPPTVRMGATQVFGRCAGAAYLAGVLDRPPPARVELALLRDGRCAPGDVDPDASDDACRDDAPLTGTPSVAILDHRTGSLSLHGVPAGCRPERLVSVGGVGVLLCAPSGAGGAAVYLAGAAGAWNAEGTLPIGPTDYVVPSIAPDGTLLLRVAWEHPTEKRAFVRSPRPLGDPAAWREVDVSSAFEVRVDVGGALVLFGTVDRVPFPAVISLARDAPGEPRRTLAKRVPVEGSLLDAAIEGRRVVVWQSDRILTSFCNPRLAPVERRLLPERVVTRDGRLVSPR